MSEYAHDNVVPFEGSAVPKKLQVADMFDAIAHRYDFLNRFLSAGIDLKWRKSAIRELKAERPGHVLDMATGTGDMAILAEKMLKPAKITGMDISEGMLAIGRKKIEQLGLSRIISLVTGDAETINAPDNSFDAVMVAFGVRNFQHLENGLQEIRRVLKPGGKLVVLEFSKPRGTGIRQLYGFYMDVFTPAIGKLFSKNRSAYQYLNQSIKHFPEGKNFTSILDRLGYSDTYCKPQHLGICSIYCGRK